MENIFKVSVIIPTYNRAHLIKRAIESILNQSFQDFEIIIVDDGSTDSTEDVIKSFQEKDKRIRYFRHGKNEGEGAARNTGIKLSQSPFIAFQDSDDISLPERLEKQVKILEKEPNEVGLVYSDMWRITKKEKSYFHSPTIMPENKITYNKALAYGVLGIGIGSSLLRREVFKKTGIFDEGLPVYIDLEFFIRLSKYYYFYHIAEPLIKYFEEEDSLTANNNSIIKARKLILKKYYDDIKKDKIALEAHYLGLCLSLYKNNEFEEAREYAESLKNLYSSSFQDRKILSNTFNIISNNLFSENCFYEGREYLFKTVKTFPVNLKLIIKYVISLAGEKFFYTVLQIARDIKINQKKL